MPVLSFLAAVAQSIAQMPAQPPAQPATATPPPHVQLPELKIRCRTERVTGSRMVKRTCRTPEEQRRADLDARNKLKLGTQVRTTDAFKSPAGH